MQHPEARIYILVTQPKISRGLYLHKRAQIKEHHNSCEDDSPFCLPLCTFFFFFNYFVRGQFLCDWNKPEKVGMEGKKEGPRVWKKKKTFDHTRGGYSQASPSPLFSSNSLHSPEVHDGTTSRKPAETSVIDNRADYSESMPAPSENPQLNQLLQTCLDPVSGSSVRICQTIQSCVAASSPSMAAAPLTAARSRVRAFHHSQVSEERRIERWSIGLREIYYSSL